MTEQEASDALEVAITNWLRASGQLHDDDMLTGWVLVGECVDINRPKVSIVTQTAADDLSLVRQLGLLDYAMTVVRDHVVSLPEG